MTRYLMCLALLGTAQAQICDGKVYGIFEPLRVAETPAAITVSGGTFAYVIERASGQIASARVLGQEYVAPGASFPNPYIGVMPEDDPGARREGGKERPRFGYEKSAEIRPRLWSGGLTSARRFDAAPGPGIRTELLRASPEAVDVRATGNYGDTPLFWTIDYHVDVDGFTKVTVGVGASRPVLLRWHCFNHAFFDKSAAEYLTKVNDPGPPPTEVLPQPTVPLHGVAPGQPVFESHWNAFFHLSNRATGIEFSKQDFGDRHSGYRDSAVVLEDGREVDTGTVETAQGERLTGWDSRGRNNIFTQLYVRDRGLELEEFDIRNTTFPLNPGEVRKRVFWVQLTPAKHAREDLNSVRAVWPGPHQIVMPRWRGRQQPWEPPSDEQVKLWAQMGVNLIVGGADYWSGDYTRPLAAEKIRHFLATAHRYGIKVIPYVTFADFNFAAPGYQEHAAEWMASASIEYANETTLMCYNAKGWREFLERQWDDLLGRFEFDGLYIDHWINVRFCSNSRHGCGGYLGSFATEGYHDFAVRARRVVARHTGGKGIMLLNANMLLFSGVVPWFDIRLNGENDDPLRMREETILTTWDGRSQGVQSMGEWRNSQDSLAMLNLLTAFAISGRAVDANDLEQWKHASSGELAAAKDLWGIWRFFGVNGARRFSGYDAGGLLKMEQPGSVVNAFAREGRVLVVMGARGAGRQERLHIADPSQLGLVPGRSYEVIDLREKRHVQAPPDLRSIPVELAGEPRILVIRPADRAPNLAWFRGAEEVTVSPKSGLVECRLKAVAGAPVELYFDAKGRKLRPETPGFQAAPAGDFVVLSGTAPEDGIVRLRFAN